MSIAKTWQTESNSSSATEQLAEQLGAKLRGGEVIELVSDLGGGKTTFVCGLARGLGSADRVASPTFTVSKVYKAGDKELHHFDFYRLTEAGLMEHEVGELLHDSHTIVVVEWGEVVGHILPKERITLRIAATGDEARKLTFQYPPSLGYLFEGLH